MNRRAVTAAGWLAALVLAGPAAAWELSAGWVGSDAALQHEQSGIHLGLANRQPLGAGGVELIYSLDYVQKRGAQPALFDGVTSGFVQADAAVTLHCLQPTLAVAFPLGAATALPRPFLGLAVALKLDEAWDDFPGTPQTAYGYRDLDAVLVLGLLQDVGPVTLDVRYGTGLTDQLLIDTSGTSDLPAKAGDPVPGEAPEVDASVSYLQVGLRFAF